jgi:photosystem II stability/assembly factor-like uncharacterized protein
MPRARVIIPVAVTLVIVGCGSSHHATASSTTTTSAPSLTSTASATATATRTASTQPTTRTVAPAVAPPAGGPVPRGFRPADFTAISASTFWLLGTAPCSRPVCTSIVRTTDGGAHFVGIPAPPAPLGTQEPADISRLRFANRLDGYAAGPGFPTGGAIWSTRNGGGSWQRSLTAPVLAFDISGGMAYAVTGVCANDACHGVALLRSRAGSTRWSSTPVAVSVASAPIALTAHGESVWVSVSPASGRGSHQVLLHSGDGGSHLALVSDPCLRGLGARLTAVSATGLWAVCPTGMQAGLWRSTDGGARWTASGPGPSSRRRPLANSALVAPVNTTTAVIAPGGGDLLLTTDGGRVLTGVTAARPGSGQWTFLGFTDPSTGSGLLQTSAGPTQLWRTADGGVRWHGPVRIR